MIIPEVLGRKTPIVTQQGFAVNPSKDAADLEARIGLANHLCRAEKQESAKTHRCW